MILAVKVALNPKTTNQLEKHNKNHIVSLEFIEVSFDLHGNKGRNIRLLTSLVAFTVLFFL